jgi:hypothetical protein
MNHSSNTTRIKTVDFAQFLVEQTPKFDEAILASIKPEDGWLLNINTGTMAAGWWMCREAVRQISEGQHYTPSPSEAMGCPTEITKDRFAKVFPIFSTT